MSDPAGVQTYVHAGVVVEDLDAAVGFFALLGFECGSPMRVGGDWVGRIIDLDDVQLELVMVRAPDGTGELELVKFLSPAEAPGPAAPANRPGIRHLAYKVGDLRATVRRLGEAGWPTVREIVDYEDQYLLCYVRGPEGIIVELAEELATR